MPAPDIQCLHTIPSQPNVISALTQETRDELANQLFIFDHENGFLASNGLLRRGLRLLLWLHFLAGRRQINFELRSFADVALGFDPPLVLFDEPIRRRQAHTRAFADFFGSKKWLKQSALGLLIHAATRIGNGDAQELPLCRFRMMTGVLRANLYSAGSDHQ